MIKIPVLGTIKKGDNGMPPQNDNHVVWYAGAEDFLAGRKPKAPKARGDVDLNDLTEVKEVLVRMCKVLDTAVSDSEKVGACKHLASWALYVLGDGSFKDKFDAELEEALAQLRGR
jgi:hypothetical protein